MDACEEPLTPEVESAILGTIPPRALLAAIRSMDGIAERLFGGFRVKAESLKLPTIRQRLQREVAGSPGLQERLRELWLDVHEELAGAVGQLDAAEAAAALPGLVKRWGRERVEVALRLDARPAMRALPLPAEEAPQANESARGDELAEQTARGQAAGLREQVRSLRRELHDARKEQAAVRGQLEEARHAADAGQAAARDSAKEAAELRRASARAARQTERLQHTKADLEARLREAAREARRLEGQLESMRRQEEQRVLAQAEERAAMPPADAWLQAARDLVHQGGAQAAVNLLAPLAGKHPESGPVREVLAEAYQALGALPAAVTELCWLAHWHTRQARPAEAFRSAARAMMVAPEDPAARRCVRDTLAAIPPDDEDAWPAALRHLRAVGSESPMAGQAIEGLLPAERRASHAAAGSGHRRVDLDTPVQWPQGDGTTFTASLRAVIGAVDANQTALVQRVRRALSLMEVPDSETHRAILRALARHDDTYRSVLVRATRPVVVDGSNVAWHALEAAGRPRLENVLALRRELRDLGYFPILVYVDASLMHQIDRRAELEVQVARGEVLAADAGTDADEAILRCARELHCVVVTNDRMLEHDPEGSVTKLRFEVGPEGAAIRDWHEHQ